jgi:hypothetical protein
MLHDILIAALVDTGRQTALLTEMEALTAIVRLLAVGTGDPNGDTVTRDLLDPRAAELERRDLGAPDMVTEALRSQTMVGTILDLLDRRCKELDKGDLVYLQWEALKALRLVITPEGLMSVGAPHVETSTLWPKEDNGYMRNGDMQRRLVEVLLQQLSNIGDTMGQKPKVAILGSLWSLAATSNYIRTRILQAGGEQLVATLFHAQVFQPGLILEAALVAECGVLVSLVGGSRTHERNMAKLGVDKDAVEMLRKFQDYREAACAGLVLLALLANDDTVAARLSASPEALAIISAARKRWPEESEKAFQNNAHYVSPAAATLVKSPPARNSREMTHRGQARNRPARNRPIRAAAACVVGRAAHAL